MYMKRNERFLVRSHWIPTHARPGKWRLTIDDDVERSTQITLFGPKKLPDAGRANPVGLRQRHLLTAKQRFGLGVEQHP